MAGNDTIRALNHPYRQEILRVLEDGGTTYSGLFECLEPDGGERGRFNYHLRLLRRGDLVQITNGLYRLSQRGETALVFLKEVSDHPISRGHAKQTGRIPQPGRVQRIGHALRSRIRSVPSFRHGTVGRAGTLTTLAAVFIVAGIVITVLGAVAWMGTFSNSPLAIMIYTGLLWGPILVAAGGILDAMSERRQTAGEWVGWAFILSGLGWGFLILFYLGWMSHLVVTITGSVLALVLIAVGVGAISRERRSVQRAVVS